MKFMTETVFLRGLEKYGKKKAGYGKIFVFPDFWPYLIFL